MSDLRLQITQFIEKHFLFAHPLTSGQTPLFSNGTIDSFGVLELISFLEKTFHIRIDTTAHELLEFDTLDSITALVESLQVKKP